jgi:hypothetical protein
MNSILKIKIFKNTQTELQLWKIYVLCITLIAQNKRYTMLISVANHLFQTNS